MPSAQFQTIATKYFETLPSEVKYNFRQNLKLTEDQLAVVNYKILIKDNSESEHGLYIKEDYYSPSWFDYWRVYGDDILLWQGAMVSYNTIFNISDSWRALYPYTMVQGFYPCWNNQDYKIWFATNPNYPGEGEKIVFNLPTFWNGENWQPIYSTVRVTKNLPDLEYKELLSLFAYIGSENNYFLKKSENDYDLCIEGTFFKRAKSILSVPIVPSDTLDETYTVTVQSEFPYAIIGTRISYITGLTPEHFVWTAEPSTTKFKLLINVINPKIFYGDKKNVL
jgi:hypothetical protein